MNRLCIYTAEYNATGTQLDLFRESCSRFGLTLRTYGQGREWPGWLFGKSRDGAEFLNSIAGEYEYAMWVDGFDSLVLADENKILETYKTLGDGKIVIASERNCWPDAELAEFFPMATGKRYVNAGGYMGPIELLANELRTVIRSTDTDNDQDGWAIRYLEAYPEIVLDSHSKLFRSMSDGGGESCIKHWNGRIPGREEYWRSL